MKNRRKKRWRTTGMFVLLFVWMMGMFMWKTENIYATQVDTQALTMTQSAAWTEGKKHQGEILVELWGWKTVLEEGKNKEITALEVQEAQAEAQMGQSKTQAPEEETGVTEEVETAEEAGMTEEAETAEEAGMTEEAETAEETGMTEEAEIAEGELQNGEAVSQPELFLVYFLSPYFEVTTSKDLPKDCTIEEVVKSQKETGQEPVTKITCPIPNTEEEVWKFRLPISLRSPYTVSERDQDYPTAEPLPVLEGQTGTGIYLVKKQGEEWSVLAEAEGQFLTVAGVSRGFSLEVLAGENQIKAGELAECKVKLRNTGEADLHQVELFPSFSIEGIKGTWEGVEGFSGGSAEEVAVLETLLAGEEKQLTLFVSIPEEQENPLRISIKAATPDPVVAGAWLEQNKELSILVTPLKADYTVEKTADRSVAYPGETITYQICIRNTGEKTLHSVVSTERFLTAGMTAQFLPQTGVTLNSSKTQALVPRLERGQAVALVAEVVVPQNFQSQELMNQVTVVTAETGSRSVQSSSSVQVYAPTPTAVPSVTQGLLQTGYQSKNGGSMSKGASSYPKTGDPSQGERYAGILGLSLGLGAAVILYRRARQRKEKEFYL